MIGLLIILRVHYCMSILKKGLYFSDIHFGRKSNSSIHNQDCLNFLSWVTTILEKNPDIDYVSFLGDWHESRSAIDVETINYSYKGAKIVDSWNLPVYFIVGNHDMGSRHEREIYSTINFNEFKNFKIISEITVAPEMLGGAVFVPFITKTEYPTLQEHTKARMWAGHFEFKDFVLTGYSVKLEHGPDIDDFKDVGHILSGHFHKRQSRSNTHYIGNCFPMDFGDANDFARGIAIYDHVDEKLTFTDWVPCPKYIKCSLSQLLVPSHKLYDDSYVDVNIDIPVTYEELGAIEHSITSKYKLRGFKLDESSKFIQENSTLSNDSDDSMLTVDQIIIQSLSDTSSDQFDATLLVDIYRDL